MKKAILLVGVFTLFLATIAKAQNSFTFARPDGSHFGCVVMPDSTVKITGGGPDTINGNLILPDTVTHNGRSYVVTVVGVDAFRGGVTGGSDYFIKPWPNVYIPNTVKLIERQAFFNMASWEMYIGSSVDSLGSDAFKAGFYRKLIYNAKNCNVSQYETFAGTCGTNFNVHELVIGDSVQVIPTNLICATQSKVHRGTINMNPRVTIGASVRYIGDGVLSHCASGNTVHYIMRCPPPTLSQQATQFIRTTRNVRFHIPCHLQSLYRADSVWSTINFDTTPYFIEMRALHGRLEQLATPDCGNDTLTLRAIPDADYRFVHWNDGDTNATHSFVVSGDTTITARFEPVTNNNVVYFFDFQNPAQDTMWKLVPDRFRDSVVTRWVIDKQDNHNINGSRCMRIIYVRPRTCSISIGLGGSSHSSDYEDYFNSSTASHNFFAHTRQSMHFNGLYIPRFDENYYLYLSNLTATPAITVALLPDSVDIPDSALVKHTFDLPSSAITLNSGQKTFIPEGSYRLVIKYFSYLADTLGAAIDNIMFEKIDSAQITIASCFPRHRGLSIQGNRYRYLTGTGDLSQVSFSGKVKVYDTLTLYPTPLRDSTKGHFGYWGTSTNRFAGNLDPIYYDSISNVLPLRYVVYNDDNVCAVYHPNKFPLIIDTTGLPDFRPEAPAIFRDWTLLPRYSVFGEGMYDWNTWVTVGITVPQGWVFTQWDDGNTENPRLKEVTDTTILRPILVPATVTLSPLSENVYASWSDGNIDNPRTIKYPSDTALTVMYGTRIDKITNGDFEDSISTYPWVLVNGQNTNRWVVGTAMRNGGQRGLYISDNGGATNHSTNSCDNVYAYVRMRLDTGTYYCSFNWRLQQYFNYMGFMSVALVPDSNTITATTNDCASSLFTYPAGSIIINSNNGGKFGHTSNWQKHEESVTVSSSGIYKLVFGWTNKNYVCNQPAAIDNVIFRQSNVSLPQDFIPIYDTVQLQDTLWVNDTIWHNDTIRTHVFDTTTIYIYDTIHIYDTVHVYDTTHVSIQGAEAMPWKIGQDGGCIIVSGAEGYNVKVYDVSGRCLHIQSRAVGVLRFRMPAAGVYLVQVGDSPAQRVVIPHL